jgi:methylmalonyl-CoA/ethylmalonyl-CoA epimerase
MSPNDFGLTAIGQIAINVHDTDRATAFYRDKLGMKFLFSAPPSLAFFDCGGIRLMLSPAPRPEFDHPSSIIYFKVADIQSTYATMLERGVTFEEPPAFVVNMGAYDLWIASFRDSEDNILAMMCEIAH